MARVALLALLACGACSRVTGLPGPGEGGAAGDLALAPGVDGGGGKRTFRFAPAMTIRAGDCPYAIAAADLDGDGATDLAVVDGKVRWMTILHGMGDGRFTQAETFPEGNSTSIVATDLNGDGRADLTWSSRDGDAVGVMLGAGGGKLVPAPKAAVGNLSSTPTATPTSR